MIRRKKEGVRGGGRRKEDVLCVPLFCKFNLDDQDCTECVYNTTLRTTGAANRKDHCARQ